MAKRTKNRLDSRTLYSPLTVAEMRLMYHAKSLVRGVISMDLDTIVGCDQETFLDSLSVALTDTELLMNIWYRPLKIGDDGEILIEVEGDPSGIPGVAGDICEGCNEAFDKGDIDGGRCRKCLRMIT